jgi:hypothetical protein
VERRLLQVPNLGKEGLNKTLDPAIATHCLNRMQDYNDCGQ